MKYFKMLDLRFTDPKMEKEYTVIKKQNVLKDYKVTVIVILLVTLTVSIERIISMRMSEFISSTTALVILLLIFFLHKLTIFKEYIEYLMIVVIIAYNIYRLIIMRDNYAETVRAHLFFSAYTYAILQMIMISRVPGNYFKIAVVVLVYVLRYVFIIYAIDEKALIPGNIIRGIIVDAFILYYYYFNEKTERKVFQNFYESREELKKFKELLADFPQSVTVIDCEANKPLFCNTTFVSTFEKPQISLEVQNNTDSSIIRFTPGNNPIPKPYLSSLQVDQSSVRELGVTTTYTSLKETETGGSYTFLRDVMDSLSRENIQDDKTLSLTASYTYQEQRKSFEVTLKRIRWDRVDAIAIILNDITYQESLIALKSTIANKDKILATVSHELRTPLNGIISLLDVARKHIIHPEALYYLSLSKDNARLLLSIVNCHLDLQMMEARKLDLNLSKVDLAKVTNDVVQLLQFHANTKNLLLESKIEKDTTRTAITDENRLKQILINLVGNAIKFTSTGSITIQVSNDFEDENCLRISVIDTGRGIKDEDKKKLFTVYGKLDEGKQVNKSGIGLGLNISNALALLLNGKADGRGIEVESQHGVGSNFSFRIMKNLQQAHINSNRRLQTSIEESKEGLNGDTRKGNIGNINEMSFDKYGMDGKPSTYEDHMKESLPSECEEEPYTPLNMNSKLKGYTSMRRTNIFDLNAQSRLNRSIDEEGSPLEDKGTLHLGLTNLVTDSHRNLKEGADNEYTKLKLSESVVLSQMPPKKYVLVVDDNPFNLLVTVDLIKDLGYSFKKATGGREAIQLVKTLNQEGKILKVILMDCLMPEMDGYETSKRLKEMMNKEEIPKTPIIALTANSNSKEEAKKCYDSGMDGYLTKPLTSETLQKTFEKLK